MDNVLEGDGEGRLQRRHVQAVRTEGTEEWEGSMRVKGTVKGDERQDHLLLVVSHNQTTGES